LAGNGISYAARPVPLPALASDAFLVPGFGLGVSGSTPLVYVVDEVGVSVYDEQGSGPIETLRGWFGQPRVDKHGNLYLGNANHVAVFPPGSTQPSKSIILGASFNMSEFALDANGNIWATQFSTGSGPSAGPGQLFEFDDNGNLLRALQCSKLTLFGGVTVDGHGDAFVNGWDEKGGQRTGVVEWPGGSTQCRRLVAQPSSPSSMEVTDSGDLIVEDASTLTLTTYAAPRFHKVVATTELKRIDGAGYASLALRKGDGAVFSANEDLNTVTRFRYPAGGAPTLTIPGFDDPVFVAVSPCAQQNC
jgi:hypothetical protein